MSKLLYLASLPHSGSTLTSLLVGQHPRMIGIGGVDRAMKLISTEREKTATGLCTCGKTVQTCPFWSQVLAASASKPPRNREERYRMALAVFAEVFGPDAWAADSSKHVDPLPDLATYDGIDVRVVHLVKDFRSATISAIDLKRARKNVRRPAWLLGIEAAHRWCRENGKIRTCLSRTGFPFLSVGYEELCLAPNRIFSVIANFLEVEAAEIPPTIAGSRSHLFIGNAMRRDQEKAQLLYDYRWFSRWDWRVASLVMPWLAARNRDWVYTNQISKVFASDRRNKSSEPTGSKALT